MSAPRVSVIVPCHDLGAYLDEAVQSVLSQTFADAEILVIDDGSTEPATVALLDGYARPRTTVVRCENRGLSGARNLGVARAAGEYVCCLDCDDMLEPTWLARAVAILDADPTLAFASHWFHAFGDEEWEWKPTRCDLLALLDSNTLNSAALVRRGVLLDVGGFDESMRTGCEDWEFWIRLLERGHRGTIVPEPLYRYRRRADSMSRGMPRHELYAGIVERHPESYRRHLLELLLRREATILDVVRASDAADDLHPEVLEASVAERQAELARARARLAEVERVEAVERELRARIAALEAELQQLRSSWSWTITAPVRRLAGAAGFRGKG